MKELTQKDYRLLLVILESHLNTIGRVNLGLKEIHCDSYLDRLEALETKLANKIAPNDL